MDLSGMRLQTCSESKKGKVKSHVAKLAVSSRLANFMLWMLIRKQIHTIFSNSLTFV